MTLVYARDFLDLQVRFARRVQVLSGRPLVDVLLTHTNLYVRFGLGRGFDPQSLGWQLYLAGIGAETDIEGWTYAHYLRNGERNTMTPNVTTFGCFSYGILEGNIRLHFRSSDAADPSPLRHDSIPRRLAELTRLFRHAGEGLPGHTQVIGGSWLYNLRAYRRLFPESFACSAAPFTRPSFHSMRLWGQLVNGQGRLRRSVAESFLDALERASLENLASCFPLQPLSVSAPLSDFLGFYPLNAIATSTS